MRATAGYKIRNNNKETCFVSVLFVIINIILILNIKELVEK